MGTFACRPPVAHHGYSQSPDPGCSVAHPRNRPHPQPVTNRPGNTLLTGSASLLLSATPPTSAQVVDRLFAARDPSSHEPSGTVDERLA